MLVSTAASQPLVWYFLGYPFEAASMIAGLAACLMARLWASLHDYARRWEITVDVTVTAIALLFTAGWIILERPAPFYALLSGTGFGALGAGIIAIAVRWVRRLDPSGSNAG